MEQQPQSKKSGWRTFFIVVGIIVGIILILLSIAIISLIVIKPYGIDITKLPAAMWPDDSAQPSSYDHPLLSPPQEKMLESLGVDLKTIPTSITPEQEQCAVAALGQERVTAIKAGAEPSLTDYLKAKSCF